MSIDFPAPVQLALAVGDVLHEWPVLCALIGMGLAVWWRLLARLPVRPLTRWMTVATVLVPLLCVMIVGSLARGLCGHCDPWRDWGECVLALVTGWAAGRFRGLRTRPPVLRPWP